MPFKSYLKLIITIMSAPKKGDLSSSEKELFEVITAGKPCRLTLILLEHPTLGLAPVTTPSNFSVI